MAKNFSRNLLQPAKHYSGVRWAMGRVLSDADFNEGTRLLEEERRSTMRDLVGPNASADRGFAVGTPWPAGARPMRTAPLRPGDEVTAETVLLGGAEASIFPVTLQPGGVFVGGDRVSLLRSEHVAFQRDFLQMQVSDVPPASEEEAFRTLYYLHVWEQLVGAAEDDELDEVMLRGEPPSVRVRRMRRVEVFDGVEVSDESCELAFQRLLAERYSEAAGHRFDPLTQRLDSTARLQLIFSTGVSADTCAPSEPNVPRYLGLGNVTLHVMLSQTNRFVWTVEDTRLFRVKVSGLEVPGDTLTVELLSTPENDEQLPLLGRVVELLPFGALLEGGDLPARERHPHARKVAAEVGAFARVTKGYERGEGIFEVSRAGLGAAIDAMVHTWDPAHPDAQLLDVDVEEGAVYMYARLWHYASSEADVEIACADDLSTPPLGITGVVPVFHETGRAGDYWQASLRSDSPTLLLPHNLHGCDGGVPPHGPLRYLAPIGSVWGDEGEVTKAADCRPRIRRVTESSCVTITVGDGVESIGDYTSIQAAIDALPSSGGTISLRPGVYEERVQLRRRRNVTISGCGDSTILQTPSFGSGSALFECVDSEGISLSNFTLRAIEQRGLVARNVVDLNLAGVHFEAAVREEGLLKLGARWTGPPLAEFISVSALHVVGGVVDAAQRPGFSLISSEICTLDNVELRGGSGLGPLAVAALLGVTDSSFVKIRDCLLHAYGQVGVSVVGRRSEDIEILDTRIEGHQHRYLDGVYEARSAIDFDDGVRLSVVRSHLLLDGTPSDYAVAVVRGHDVLLRSNRILVNSVPLDPTAAVPILGAWAFGGVQIRGGSASVELRDNEIRGGVGHGITLGSVLWRRSDVPATSAAGTLTRFGVGRGQIVYDEVRLVLNQDLGQGFVDPGGWEFIPTSEGFLEDLTISGNHIEGMAANGISAVTVLGLVNRTGELIELRRALIEGNTISGNLTWPGRSLPSNSSLFPFPASSSGTSAQLSVLNWGGIVLAGATEGVDIRNNEIRNNGGSRTATLPVSGVFVLVGDQLNISQNRITNNGVEAPRAVVGEGGPVAEPLLAGTRAGIGVLLVGVGNVSTRNGISQALAGVTGLDAGGDSLRVVGNTVVQPEGRALLAVGTGPFCIEGNFFSSRGFHGAQTNQDRFAVGDVVYVQNLGKPWEAFGIREGDTPSEIYEAPESAERYLLNEASRSPRMFLGEGGALLFGNNQVTYDCDVKRLKGSRSGTNEFSAPLGFFTVALLGLDQVSVTGNQFGMRVLRDPALGTPRAPDTILTNFSGDHLAQVFVMGGLVQVTRNRCASGLQITRFSLIAYGELATSVGINHFTHEYLALLQYRSGRLLKEDSLNLVIDPQMPPAPGPPMSSIPPPVQSQPIPSGPLGSFQRQLEQRFLRLLRRGFVV